MSINTGGYIVSPTHVELMVSNGAMGSCGSDLNGGLIHRKGKYCSLSPQCISIGMWYKNKGAMPIGGGLVNVITKGSMKNGKMSDNEYELSKLRWGTKNDSDIAYYRFIERLDDVEEDKGEEMIKEKKYDAKKMGKFGTAEVTKMGHYFQSIEKTMKPFMNFIHEEPDGKFIPRRYWHLKQGGTVCIMAHVDTVKTPTIPRHYNGTIWAKGLDDRLGVYLAMKLFGERDDVDVIITDDEEIGQSTADMLTKEDLEQYNSILELDRDGNDFVHYGCAESDLINAYSIYAEEGLGSYSDIASITDEARQCGCINIGIGYKNAHGDDSYVKIDDLAKSWRNINTFIDIYHNVKFKKADKNEYDWDYSYNSTKYGHNNYIPGKKDAILDLKYCDYCGHDFYSHEMADLGDGQFCCEDCFNTMTNLKEEGEEVSYQRCSECGLELMKYEEKEGKCEYCAQKVKKEWVGHCSC